MALSDVANIQISTTGGGLTAPGFGTPLILGAHSEAWPERTRFYTDLVGGVDLDFLAGSPEYLAAQAIFSQNPRPERIAIGRCTRHPTPSWRILNPAAVPAGTLFRLMIDSVAYSYDAGAAPTRASVAAGIVAAINAGTATHGLTASAVEANAAIDLVEAEAGTWHRLMLVDQAPGVQLFSLAETTPDEGVAEDLAEIALESGGEWYAPILIHKSAEIVAAAAAWVEANEKLLAVASQDTAIPNTPFVGGADIATSERTLAHARTGVLYDPDNGTFFDAGLLGRVLPLTPGSETWALKTISGQPARAYTATQIQNLKDKFCGWYYSLWGRNVTQEGKVAANEYFDSIRGRDALKVDMQSRVFLRAADADKIPFTDAGAAMFRGEIAAALAAFTRTGFLEEGSVSIKMPAIATVSENDRRQRRYTGIRFSARMQGAIHKLDIQGTLTA